MIVGDVSQGVMKGAVEVIIGGAFGIAWGLLAGFLLDEVKYFIGLPLLRSLERLRSLE